MCVTHVLLYPSHVTFHSDIIEKSVNHFLRKEKLMRAQEQLQVSGQIAEDTNQHRLILEAHPQTCQSNKYRLEGEKDQCNCDSVITVLYSMSHKEALSCSQSLGN